MYFVNYVRRRRRRRDNTTRIFRRGVINYST